MENTELVDFARPVVVDESEIPQFVSPKPVIRNRYTVAHILLIQGAICVSIAVLLLIIRALLPDFFTAVSDLIKEYVC